MRQTDIAVNYIPYDDYAQSANTLFHFLSKSKYLKSILVRRALVTRYCIETIDYLSISNGNHTFSEVAVLQKCFYDIPFHKLAEHFPVKYAGAGFELLSPDEKTFFENSNTHFAYYGEYGIAFSKSWGEQKSFNPFTI